MMVMHHTVNVAYVGSSPTPPANTLEGWALEMPSSGACGPRSETNDPRSGVF